MAYVIVSQINAKIEDEEVLTISNAACMHSTEGTAIDTKSITLTNKRLCSVP